MNVCLTMVDVNKCALIRKVPTAVPVHLALDWLATAGSVWVGCS